MVVFLWLKVLCVWGVVSSVLGTGGWMGVLIEWLCGGESRLGVGMSFTLSTFLLLSTEGGGVGGGEGEVGGWGRSWRGRREGGRGCMGMLRG